MILYSALLGQTQIGRYRIHVPRILKSPSVLGTAVRTDRCGNDGPKADKVASISINARGEFLPRCRALYQEYPHTSRADISFLRNSD
jgi:hypothetical protein